MAAEVDGQGSGFEVRGVRALFGTRPVGGNYPYDSSPDGQRFLVNSLIDDADAGSSTITVVLNWDAGLKR